MLKAKEVEIAARFIEQLKHHLQGLTAKIVDDFSKESFEKELSDLSSDSIYSKFNLNTREYALIRKMGRISISIGRRLGEIYDKLPRLIASSAFNIPIEEIAPKIGGKLELDTCIAFSSISMADQAHVIAVTNKHTGEKPKKGIGIEVRYNFNPNDSARLRKDVDMAQYLVKAGLLPVYLVFSSISPRDEAIARLKRAGWIFLIGKSALAFTKELYCVDLLKLLDQKEVKETIKKQTTELMKNLYLSYAFKVVAEKYT